jgi:flagellar basal body P-ring protein FlgI
MKRLILLCCGMAVVGGCTWLDGLTMRSQSPDEPETDQQQIKLVGDLVVPAGMEFARVETVGLVTGLHGTGSDPSPSPQRDALMEEMKVRGVTNANAVLKSGDVSLVLLTGMLRPGVQKGDRFDIEVRVPSQSETTSLRGGYLLDAWLTETAVLSSQVHRGNRLAAAQGPVMVDPMADPKKDRIAACRGRILGGGVALKSRPLGLVLTPGHQSVLNSSRVANAVNKRFHITLNGIKSGVAKAKTNEYIELAVHPRYKDNITRYVQVIRALPLSETSPERMQRINALQSQLLEPTTSADAALQLEAVGPEGANILLKGVASKDPEVRFYAAEALAYLDRREAAEPLGQIARDQPAFRVFALTALSAMQEYAAYEQLRDLLSSSSAETRYGAFRSLWASSQKGSLTKGENLGGQFHYHVLDVAGPPMIHVTRSRVPEIVVFGPEQHLLTPLAVNAGNEIMVTSSGAKEISVSRFCVREGDQKRTVSTRIDDVIRAIVELGGTYPDVVQALQEAKRTGALDSRFEVDALPEAGRMYDRVVEDGQEQNADGKDSSHSTASTKAIPARATPDLFATRGESSSTRSGKTDTDSAQKHDEDGDSDGKNNTEKGFFARMLGR